ncbi:sigma-70 family RNA polymerase sigma factor [Bacteroidales bacterium]|nr:sigma-70 family RNA polymerase sigma factor [Bacteroidales bacterium]
MVSGGGTREQAQEIFNDSLLLLIEKVSDPTFVLSSSLQTYLFGIARFLWMNESRKNMKYRNEDWNEALDVSMSDFGYDEEKEQKLQAIESILDSITEKCKQILELFYYKQLSMKVIADKLQFTSVNSAKTQKYKCLEKAIQLSENL